MILYTIRVMSNRITGNSQALDAACPFPDLHAELRAMQNGASGARTQYEGLSFAAQSFDVSVRLFFTCWGLNAAGTGKMQQIYGTLPVYNKKQRSNFVFFWSINC